MARAGLGQGWTCLLANDFSLTKAQSYVENWGADDLIVGDVFDLHLDSVPGSADLAWGSFPCQDLSLAGSGAGLRGGRSGAFWGFWDIVSGLDSQGRKPRTVVIENVYGALTANNGRDVDQILQAATAAGYVVGAMVLDAVHFIPQSRPRLFVLCVDEKMNLPGAVYGSGPTAPWHPEAIVRAYARLPLLARQAWR